MHIKNFGEKPTSPDYEKSKSLLTIPNLEKISKKFKEDVLSCGETASERGEAAQALADEVCKALKIPTTKICVRDSHQLFKNKRNSSSMRSKVLGRCWRGRNIEIWNKTAKLQKVVSIKTFYGTLLHEICHHIDWECLGFSDSLHTSGFYQRISYLDSCFK